MREKESRREGEIKHMTIMNAYSEVQNSFDVSSWPAGQENKCFFILIEKINSLTWCLNISAELSHFHFFFTTENANVWAEGKKDGTGWTEAMKWKRRRELKESWESLAGVIWLIIVNGDSEGEIQKDRLEDRQTQERW